VRIAGAIMKIEDLNGIKPEGLGDDVWSKVAESFVAANDADVLKLKSNEVSFKKEKEELAAKCKDFETKYGSASGEVEQLKKQLEEKNPEKIKDFYTSEIDKTKKTYEGAITERDKTINEYKAAIDNLSKFKHTVQVNNVFDEAAKDKNIDTSAYSFLRSTVVGKDGENFSATPIDGKDVYMSSNGKTVDVALKEFLDTPTGKRFLVSGNSGGGGPGGRGGSGNGDLTHEEWAKKSPSEKAKYSSEHHGNLKFVD
jgi:hypothetical protein